MCQHCCRMEWTPCAPIPYACPLCPVRQVADLCEGPNRGDYRRRFAHRNRKSVKRADNQMCRGISELYSNVVASKRNAKNTKRSARKSLPSNANEQPAIEIRLLPRMSDSLQKQQAKSRLHYPQHIDYNIPILYREPRTDPNTWTWTSRYPVSENVLPVHARMDDAALKVRAPQVAASRMLPCRCLLSPYD